MNIIVLTSSMTNKDFNDFARLAKIKPNPSNQNFYNKLIRSLAYFNHVSVVSLRPFVQNMFDDNYLDRRTSVEGSVKYYYPYIKATNNYKLFNQTNEIMHMVEEAIKEQGYDTFYVVVESLRYTLLKAAKLIKEKYNAPLIGVLTDNPSNISNVSGGYVSSIKKHVSNFDGYIALTDSLNRVMNIKKKPFYLMEGLVDDIEESPRLPIGEYIFFAGALYEKFGVKRMIEAYHKSKCEYKLVVAGSGELTKYVYDMSDKDRRLLYLGLLNKETLYNLEEHAKFNINPRPFDWKIDRESIPSKLLEYFSSGIPTISTNNTRLKELFEDNAMWLEDDSEKSLEKMFDNLKNKNYKELRNKALNAKMRVYELYSLRNKGSDLTQFIADIKISEAK